MIWLALPVTVSYQADVSTCWSSLCNSLLSQSECLGCQLYLAHSAFHRCDRLADIQTDGHQTEACTHTTACSHPNEMRLGHLLRFLFPVPAVRAHRSQTVYTSFHIVLFCFRLFVCMHGKIDKRIKKNDYILEMKNAVNVLAWQQFILCVHNDACITVSCYSKVVPFHIGCQ